MIKTVCYRCGAVLEREEDIIEFLDYKGNVLFVCQWCEHSDIENEVNSDYLKSIL